jgi:hypothetical protein
MGALMSQTIAAAKIRFKVEPRDIPAAKAARRLHLSLDEFRTKLPELVGRGFPAADLQSISGWQGVLSSLRVTIRRMTRI